MAIITDLKDAIRNAVYNHNENLNFNFNEIEVADFPYIFFYITSYKFDKAIDKEHWSKLTLLCVLEYAKTEDNNSTELWSYADDLSEIITNFEFKNTKLSPVEPPEFKIVDGVLQLTFTLEFYVREVDETELMEELEFTIKGE